MVNATITPMTMSAITIGDILLECVALLVVTRRQQKNIVELPVGDHAVNRSTTNYNIQTEEARKSNGLQLRR